MSRSWLVVADGERAFVYATDDFEALEEVERLAAAPGEGHFPRRVAERIRAGFGGRAFEWLVLAAAPEVLEPLVDALDEEIDDRILAMIDQDLVEADLEALKAHVHLLLPPESAP